MRFAQIRVAGPVVAVAVSSLIAAPVLFDDFNGENGGNWQLNYNAFANWDVTDGTVDLIGVGSPYDFLPGNGLYVDLDGSTWNAGIMSTKTTFTFEAGKQYMLAFDLAGNRRGYPDDTVEIDIGVGTLLSDTITLSSSDPFTQYVYYFTGDGSSGKLIIENLGGDNVGALLDDVLLTVVPLPSAAGLATLGLLAVAGTRRRARS